MVTSKISKHIGDFALAATDISRLNPVEIMASYDAVADRTFHREVAPTVAPGMHA